MKSQNCCSRIQFFAAVFLLSVVASAATARAAIVDGNFTGIVYQGYGVADGVDLSTLYGSTVDGTFSFDTATLTRSALFNADGSPNTNASQWLGSPTAPIVITETVAGHTFTFLGLVPNSLVDVQDNNAGTNAFHITASPTSSTFASMALGNSSAGVHYISNLNDPATIGFNSTGVVGYSSVSNFSPSAAFYFSVTAGSAAPVPIPAAFWLFGSGLVGLIGLMRRLST